MATTPDTLTAGPDLDARIATEVLDLPRLCMGVAVYAGMTANNAAPGYGSLREELPAYSSNMSATMDVIEHLRRQGWRIVMKNHEHGAWEVMLLRAFDGPHSAVRETLPLAICAAALRAAPRDYVDVDVPLVGDSSDW